MNERSRAVLVLRLSAFGDILHTLPAVSALRAGLDPETRLGWVVERPFEELVRLVAPVDRVFVVSTRRWRRAPLARESLGEIAALRHSLRAFASGGTSVDFQGLVKSAVWGVLGGASTRLGFDRASVRERLSLAMTNRRLPVKPAHVVELNLQLARAAGAGAEGAPLDFSRFAEDPTGGIAAQITASTIVINPGAAQQQKRWSAERFARLSAELTRLRLEPLVVWGPGEEMLARQIAAESGARLAPATSLRELAFLLIRVPLLISGDSGPLHLAAALGTPVVGLYGPTSPFRNGPYGQPGRWVESWSESRSMEAIRVEDVVTRAMSVLGEGGL